MTPTSKTALKPPKHLRASTRRWWISVATDWELEAHHRHLLDLACSAWDRAAAARDRLALDGLFVEDRFGALRAHPAVGIARDAEVSFSRLLRELDLDVEPPQTRSSRPPSLRSVPR